MKTPDTLRQEIEAILNAEVFDDTNGNAPDQLLQLIEREKREAVDEFIDRVMKLEPRVLRDIENSHADEESRLYARLCTVWGDIFGPPMKLTESNLVDASDLIPPNP